MFVLIMKKKSGMRYFLNWQGFLKAQYPFLGVVGFSYLLSDSSQQFLVKSTCKL